MCHTDIPPGQSTPDIAGAEVAIPLAGGAALPALHLSPAPGAAPVLVIADVFGRSAFYEHLGALLAQAGFQALVPDLFFRQGPLPQSAGHQDAFARRAKLDEAGSLDDLRAAIAWLRGASGHARVGTIGFCMGGTFALDLASTEDDLTSVAYYGFPVPHATLASPPPRPMDLVDDLRGPVLAFWGDQDEAVGIDHAREYARRAGAADPAFEHEILAGLGHGFLGSAKLDEAADPGGATWARTLRFLRTHLEEER
jgi:carboxymethylenebutenolidase